MSKASRRIAAAAAGAAALLVAAGVALALACASDGPEPAPRGVTGPDGAFAFAVPRALDSIVSADPAYLVVAGDAWRARDDAPLRLVVAPAGRIAGLVVDAETDLPVKARIAIALPPLEGAPLEWRDLGTAFGGAFAFDRAPSAAGVRVEASAEGYAPAAVELGPGQTDAGVLRLERAAAGRAAGVVLLPDGSPAVGARVTLGGWSGSSASDGTFMIPFFGALAPDVALLATLPPHAPAAIERFGARVLAGGDAEGLVLALGGGAAAIEGLVVDPQGAPQKRFIVEARLGGPDGPVAGASGPTRADGAFRIEGLAHGVYALRARGRGAEIAVALAVEAPSAGARLVAGPPDRRIAGVVRAPDGAPAAGATVLLEAGATAPALALADAEGRFAIERAPALPATLRARLEGALAARIDLDPSLPAEDLVLQLERGRPLFFEAQDALRPPDALHAVDAAGRVVPLSTATGEEVPVVALRAGRSPALRAPERAAALVLARGGREIARVPLPPGDPGLVRW